MTNTHPTCADCNAPFDLNYSHTSCPVCGGFAAGTRRPRSMSVVRKGETITFTSDLTDNEAATICERMTWSSFAQDLAVKYETRRGLSPKQLAWAHFLAGEKLRRDAEPKPAAQVFPGVYELLHRMADQGKAKTRSRVYWRDLRLSISSETSKVPGAITVTSSEKSYYDRAWYGRVLESGEFQASRRSDAKVTAALSALSADPTEAALAREGRVSGVCCRCNAELTDDTSKTLGYGPTCAKYLGLKHGKRAAQSAREAANAVVISAEAIEAAASEVVECRRQADGSYEFVRVA